MPETLKCQSIPLPSCHQVSHACSPDHLPVISEHYSPLADSFFLCDVSAVGRTFPTHITRRRQSCTSLFSNLLSGCSGRRFRCRGRESNTRHTCRPCSWFRDLVVPVLSLCSVQLLIAPLSSNAVMPWHSWLGSRERERGAPRRFHHPNCCPSILRSTRECEMRWKDQA